MAWDGAKADGHHNAHHCLCAWHKIHMGLHSLRLGSFPIPDSAKEVMDDVKKWLNWFCTRSFTIFSHLHTCISIWLYFVQFLPRFMQDVRLWNMAWKRDVIYKNLSLQRTFAMCVERVHPTLFYDGSLIPSLASNTNCCSTTDYIYAALTSTSTLQWKASTQL
jgi:hypothetical protein